MQEIKFSEINKDDFHCKDEGNEVTLIIKDMTIVLDGTLSPGFVDENFGKEIKQKTLCFKNVKFQTIDDSTEENQPNEDKSDESKKCEKNKPNIINAEKFHVVNFYRCRIDENCLNEKGNPKNTIQINCNPIDEDEAKELAKRRKDNERESDSGINFRECKGFRKANIKVVYQEICSAGYCKFEAKESRFHNLIIEIKKENKAPPRFLLMLQQNEIYGLILILPKPSEYEVYEHKISKKKLDANKIFKQQLSEHKASVYKVPELNYKAKIVRGNLIKYIRIDKEYPDVLAWGLHEKIGSILPPRIIYLRFYRILNLCFGWSIRNLAKHIPEDNERDENQWRKFNRIFKQAPSDRIDKEARDKIYRKIDENKQVLMEFRRLAVKKGDRVQESTINYHITKCDQQNITIEPLVPEFIQDKIIMDIGRFFSDHGKSWLRPIGVFVFINLLASLWISYLTGVNSFHPLQFQLQEYFYIVVNLFNPLLLNPMDLCSDMPAGSDFCDVTDNENCIIFTVVLVKLFYAICAYEFVRAARRFTIR